MCKEGSTMFSEGISYQCHGIVVGTVDGRQFYKGFANRLKGGLMWQKITIFGQCENTAYFDCSAGLEKVEIFAVGVTAKWRE
jgi:hypothetical protein